jgi:D-glycero-D-manno-heptose 1,7-bisphosphate phosphatase
VGNGALTRAVFLDRDGVINEAIRRDNKPFPPELNELRITPGAPDALLALRTAGFALLVVTNQPDIARQTRSQRDVDAIHQRLAEQLPIDGFYVCPHDDDDRCDCRKPLPGLLVRAAQERGIDLSASFMVGDRWRDISAGHAAGVSTVFIDYSYDEPRPDPAADATVADLQGAAAWILNRGSI